MPTAPFPVDPELTAISIAYKNSRMIANDVLPRVPVGKQEFKYKKYDLGDTFRIPDTHVGRTSEPNQVEFGYTEVADKTEDYGLDDAIPQADIDNAPPGENPVGQAVEMIASLVDLDREVRVAGKVFNNANYSAGKKVVLSGASQFSDSTSDVIGTIESSLDSMVMRANVAVIGAPVWSQLRRHPHLVKAMHGTSGDKGMISRQFFADQFELEEVLVGQAWLNTAKKGQTQLLARAWGKHMSLLYRDKIANTQTGATYGYTAQWGTRVAGTIDQPKVGLRGTKLVRSGESVKEVISASDLGYFIENAVA